MSDECKHGSLAPWCEICEICERDAEIERLRAELAEIREATTCTTAESLPAYVRNLERYRDRLVLELAEAKEKLMQYEACKAAEVPLDRRRR